ncbi:MAG: type II secretion system protein GspD [Parachlamydiaceae bacterium]
MFLNIKTTIFTLAACAAVLSTLSAQTIAQKKASLMESGSDLSPENEKFLKQVNRELIEARLEEKRISEEAYALHKNEAPESEYGPLLDKVKELRIYISNLQESFRELMTLQGGQEGYALWYQPDTTLDQLIVDYGSQDYVYIIPPDIASQKISIDSNLPIPRASWNEMLELILSQNGVGIRQLNPFLKELYKIKEDRSAIKLITSKRKDLELLSPESRIAFLLSPDPSDVRRIWYFLDNFANPRSTQVQLVGRDILIIAQVNETQDLLRLYDFISQNRGEKEYKAITVSKVSAEEMAKVLKTIFSQPEGGTKQIKGKEAALKIEFVPGPESNGLQVLTMGKDSSVLFLIGTPEEIRKAEDVIYEVESQIAGAKDMVIHWYAVKHSDPQEVAEVLSKVYQLMVSTGAGYDRNQELMDELRLRDVKQTTIVEQPPQLALSPEIYPSDPYFQRPIPPISPATVIPASPNLPRPKIDQGNFIVDLKTGSIVMVVEAELLPRIKELIKRMDVPKRMVQLEVLLFEKRISNRNDYGLNLLRLGSRATNTTASSIVFNEVGVGGISTGIFDFLFSRERKSGIPAFDLTYRFLLSQDDVTINSNPSVVTVNQTPAFIAILDEISINTGIVEIETVGGATLKDSFQRAQYGVTLSITPTIHLADEEDGEDALDTISLDSDITFDTFDQIGLVATNRPNVRRRNIKNQARVADGETVIIGGLRRKDIDDSKDSIPFLGEIPGVGKLFSDTHLHDESSEMFIFITPKIISDPACDLEWIRQEELARRPGDVPEFMCSLIEAEECEKNRLLKGWMTTLFGRENPPCYSPGWHNDDTCGNPRGEYDGR